MNPDPASPRKETVMKPDPDPASVLPAEPLETLPCGCHFDVQWQFWQSPYCETAHMRAEAEARQRLDELCVDRVSPQGEVYSLVGRINALYNQLERSEVGYAKLHDDTERQVVRLEATLRELHTAAESFVKLARVREGTDLRDDVEALFESKRAESFGRIVVEPVTGDQAVRNLVSGLVGVLGARLTETV